MNGSNGYGDQAEVTQPMSVRCLAAGNYKTFPAHSYLKRFLCAAIKEEANQVHFSI